MRRIKSEDHLNAMAREGTPYRGPGEFNPEFERARQALVAARRLKLNADAEYLRLLTEFTTKYPRAVVPHVD